MASSTDPIKSLLERNEAWANDYCSSHGSYMEALSKTQSPKVLWLGCADSRVPESVCCHAEPGEIFVTRNVANQFNPKDDSVMSVLAYGVQALGVEHVVVVGHTSCGGVVGAIQTAAAGSSGGADSALARYLGPLTQIAAKVKAENPSLEGAALQTKVEEENVKAQVENIVKTDVMQSNWKGEPSPLKPELKNKVSVHGWIYDIKTGKLRDLGISRHPPA